MLRGLAGRALRPSHPLVSPANAAAKRPQPRALSQPSPASTPCEPPSPPAFPRGRGGLHDIHRQSRRWRPPKLSSKTEHTTPSTSSTNISSAAAVAAAAASTQSMFRHVASDARGRLFISYHDLEHALERRGLKSVRFLVAAAIAAAAAVGLMWPRIKQWGAVEGAEVAAASLQDEQLQKKAVSMVQEVLTDAQTSQQVQVLLKSAVLGLFEDKQFTDSAVEWTGKVLSDAILKDAVVARGVEYVSVVLSEKESVDAAQEYLSDAVKTIVADQSVQDEVAAGLWAGIRASVVGRHLGWRRPDADVSPAPGATQSPSSDGDPISATVAERPTGNTAHVDGSAVR